MTVTQGAAHIGLAAMILFWLGLNAPVFAQIPEYHYFQMNESFGTATADLAVPGVGGTAVFNSGWSLPGKLGASCLSGSFALPASTLQTNAPLAVTGDWTIEFWVCVTTTAPTENYCFGDASASALRCFSAGAAGSGNIMLRGPLVDVVAVGGAPLNIWAHVAFVYDNTALTVTPVVNGIAQTPVSQNSPVAIVSSSLSSGLELGGYSGTNLVGELDEFRFWSQARSVVDIVYFKDQELGGPGLANDLLCLSVDGPADAQGCATLSSSETVLFTVANYGTSTIAIGTSFTADLYLGGMFQATETFLFLNNALPRFASEQFTFAASVNMSGAGPYLVTVIVNFPGDQKLTNNAAARQVKAIQSSPFVRTLPYFENFDSFGVAGNGAIGPIPNGWAQDPGDSVGPDADWYFGTATPSASSGPETNGLGDHSSGLGRFGFIEDNSSTNTAINLWSPCLDLRQALNPQMRLYVNTHHYGTGGAAPYVNPIMIDVLTPTGIVTNAVGMLADTGDVWQAINLDLSPYVGQIVQIQIRGTNVFGSFYCDAAIDDFFVYEPATLIGQAPQPGLAILDINSAANQNMDFISSGNNGPYFTTATSPGNLNFDFRGDPFAGVLLVGANLNPQVATYPGYGQFDIGNLPLNASGIPGGLFVWADGITLPVQGLNQLFGLDVTGKLQLSISLTALPLGTLTTFQALITHSVAIVAFSNAVEVVIN